MTPGNILPLPTQLLLMSPPTGSLEAAWPKDLPLNVQSILFTQQTFRQERREDMSEGGHDGPEKRSSSIRDKGDGRWDGHV